jgi:hypothetical protein
MGAVTNHDIDVMAFPNAYLGGNIVSRRARAYVYWR